MKVERPALISKITEAFKNVRLEDGIGLSEADAIDSYSNLQHRAACRKNDEKDNWNAIPSELLNNYYCSLNFFDASGMRFHLPAFMLSEIKREYKFGMSFPLTNLSDYSRSQFALLSANQREAVKLFLTYLLEDPNYEFEKPEIQRAIDNYWGTSA